MCDDPESLRRMRYKRQVGVSRVAAVIDRLIVAGHVQRSAGLAAIRGY